MCKVIEERQSSGDAIPIGIDLASGEPIEPKGIWDNVRVKRASLSATVSIACNLLEVDEVMRAGMTNLKASE